MSDTNNRDANFYLAVPYVAEFEVVEDAIGEWWCQAECPEIPGTRVRARNITEAIDLLESRKREVISYMLAQRRSPPIPRSPLESGVCGFSAEISSLRPL